MPPNRTWTDEQLRTLVPACTTLGELLSKLGATPADGPRIRKRAHILGISTAHFPRERTAATRRWSDDELRAAVAAARGRAPTLRALGLVPAGGNYAVVQRRIRELGLDTSHFGGKAWSKGARHQRYAPTPLDEVLVANRWTGSHKLEQRLVREGLKAERCECCGWAEKRASDGVIPIELDHINGDRSDNRLENLRVLCPNCHALQATHRGLNQQRRRR